MEILDPAAYRSALDALHSFKRDIVGRSYKGRFVQIFLALKFYEQDIPSIHSGTFVPTDVFQSMLDDLYAKSSKNLNACVVSLFEANHLARTGVVPAGRRTSSNIWRNNLHLQKGIGCYASPAELASPTFLEEPRSECRHLIGTLAEGSCELCVSGASYRGEEHRKWLRIDPGGNGFAVVDLMNVDNFRPYVAPDGNRIPLVPLIYALYHDSNPALPMGTIQDVSVADFCSDFNFTRRELELYFDESPRSPINREFLLKHPSLHLLPSTSSATPTGPTVRLGSRAASTVRTPVLTGTLSSPPRSHHGWEAEQFVQSALRADGWEIHDVSRQQVGYDILAKKGRRTIYVEVKSSVGYCSPTFTSREWQQAAAHGNDYILAIMENYNPIGSNMIYWISDPALNCEGRERSVTMHSVARSSWIGAVRTLRNI